MSNLRLQNVLSLTNFSLSVFVSVALALSISSCDIKPKKNYKKPVTTVETGKDVDLTVNVKLEFTASGLTTYRDVKTILDETCVSCHSAGDKDPDLSTFPFTDTDGAELTTILEKIKLRIHDSANPMPPEGLLAEALTTQMGKFVSDGGVEGDIDFIPPSNELYKLSVRIRSDALNSDWQEAALVDGLYSIYLGSINNKEEFNLDVKVTGPNGTLIKKHTFESIEVEEEGLNHLVLRSASEDSTAPVLPAASVLTAVQVSDGKAKVSWKESTDVGSTESELTYSLYMSTSDNINNLKEIVDNGSFVANSVISTDSDSLSTIYQFDSSRDENYYFNVVVSDILGNEASYASVFYAPRGVSISLNLGLSVVSLADRDLITYQDLKSTFDDKCTRCHSPGDEEPYLDSFPFDVDPSHADLMVLTRTYQGELIEKIIESVTRTEDRMPEEDEPLTADVIEMLKKWYEAGFPKEPETVSEIGNYSVTIGWRFHGANIFRYVTTERQQTVEALFQGVLPSLDVGSAIEIDVTVKGPQGSTVYTRRDDVIIGPEMEINFTISADEEDLPTKGEFDVVQVSNESAKISWSSSTDRITPSDRLEYKVVMSKRNNISDIKGVNQATVVMSYRNSVRDFTMVAGELVNHYFNVVVRDEQHNETVYNTFLLQDINLPVAGNSGELAVELVLYPDDSNYPQGAAIKIDWTAASDIGTSPEDLEYRVVMSQSDDISRLGQAQRAANVMAFTTATTEFTFIPTDAVGKYYFNVIVKDGANGMAVYNSISIELDDFVAPVPVSENGGLAADQVDYTTAKISWNRAIDNVSSRNQVEYRVVMSNDSCGSTSTLRGATVNGRTIMDYTPVSAPEFRYSNIQMSINYCFNVIVRDAAGNQAILGQGIELKDTLPPKAGSQNLATLVGNKLQITWNASIDNSHLGTDLEYQVVTARDSVIDTPERALENGSVVSLFGTRSFNDFGLAKGEYEFEDLENIPIGTQYFFNIIVKDAAGNMAVYNTIKYAIGTVEPDDMAPVPGANREITVDEFRTTIKWTQASDNETPVNGLRYMVYLSTENNIDSVTGAELNGQPQFDGFQTNIRIFNIPSLESDVDYFFNVVVKDSSNNAAIYQSIHLRFSADPSAPAPGVITVESVTDRSALIKWTAAIDGITDQENLEYKLLSSMKETDFLSIEEAERKGTLVVDWTRNFLNKEAVGFLGGTKYFFTVLVRDGDANISIYGVAEVTTGASEVEDYDIIAHGQECASRLGYLKEFDCTSESFHVIPVPVNGEIREEFPEFGVGGSGFLKCDKPALLSGANWCQPYSTLGKIDSYALDGSVKKDTETIVICRRIARRFGSYVISGERFDPDIHGSEEVFDAKDFPIFEDVSIIQQDKKTGEACFFQMRADLDARRVAPPTEEVLPEDAPAYAVAAKDFWLPPEETAGLNCQRCHDSDPWVHTPYIDQVKGENGKTLVPSHPKADYSVIGRKFFTKWMAESHRPMAVGTIDPVTGESIENECTSCHRVGSLDTCRTLIGAATGRLHTNNHSDFAKNTFALSHWMPPASRLDNFDDWNENIGNYLEDSKKLQACCNMPDSDGCSTRPILVPPPIH